jgi:hypothetical protein
MAEIGNLIKLDGSLLQMMRDAVYQQMKMYNPYNNTTLEYKEFEYGYYGGYIAGMILLGWAGSEATAAAGTAAKAVAGALVRAGAKEGGILAKVAGAGMKAADKVKYAIQAYRNMNRASKVMLTVALYLSAVAVGTAVTMLFFPDLFDSWTAAVFGTTFIIVAVVGAYSDFSSGLQKQLSGLFKKAGREGAEELINGFDDGTKSALKAKTFKNGYKIYDGEIHGHYFEAYAYDGPAYRSPIKGATNQIGDYGENTHLALLLDSGEAKQILPGKLKGNQGIDLIYQDSDGIWHFAEDKMLCNLLNVSPL